MDLSTESQLKECFRPIDRTDVELPPKVSFPVTVDLCLTWSSGPRTFLLFRDNPERRPKGIVFHRSTGTVPDVAAMCEWCHAVRAHGGVKLLTAALSDRRQVGLYLCADLSCLDKTRELPGPNDLYEALDGDERRRKIVSRIAVFAARRLF